MNDHNSNSTASLKSRWENTKNPKYLLMAMIAENEYGEFKPFPDWVTDTIRKAFGRVVVEGVDYNEAFGFSKTRLKKSKIDQRFILETDIVSIREMMKDLRFSDQDTLALLQGELICFFLESTMEKKEFLLHAGSWPIDPQIEQRIKEISKLLKSDIGTTIKKINSRFKREKNKKQKLDTLESKESIKGFERIVRNISLHDRDHQEGSDCWKKIIESDRQILRRLIEMRLGFFITRGFNVAKFSDTSSKALIDSYICKLSKLNIECGLLIKNYCNK